MKALKACLASWGAVLALALVAPLPAYAQNDSTTYTVDPSFDSTDLFEDISGISSIIPYVDGRILVGGGFHTFGPGGFDLFRGLGMVWGDGSEYTQWGGGGAYGVPQIELYQEGFIAPLIYGFGKYTLNGTPSYVFDGQAWVEYLWPQSPYNPQGFWCVYVQEDDKVLIGGAVATDTTQPNLFRNLMRVWPDGSHDASFPAIEIEPNNEYSRIISIDRDSFGRWIVSGNFYAINGHETAFVARLNQDFSVDTTFVSPLKYVFSVPEPGIKLFDSQDRMWVSGHYMATQANPEDTINLLRILPSGSVDSTFLPRHVSEEYPNWVYGSNATQIYGGLELEADGLYILYGKFNYFNDTVQPCITVTDDAGHIQHNYLQSQGATELIYGVGSPESVRPSVGDVKQLPDGSLIVGGSFSKFMGTEHYNLIKLNRGTIGTDNARPQNALVVWPNPAANHLHLAWPGAQRGEVAVYDLSGRVVYRGILNDETDRISTDGFAPGMYLVHVKDQRGTAVKKIVVE